MDTPKAYHTSMSYAELTDTLHEWARAYPQVLELRELGRSKEGRVVWLAVVGDRRPDPARSFGGRPATANRPAFYLDANIHSQELTGSTAALALIHTLCAGSSCPEGAALLKQTTFYIIPRVSPDGAEHFMTTGEYVRSSPTLYPHEDLPDGMHRKDLDGDGCVAQMRIEDPAGGWRPSKEDPRVMVRRSIKDVEGPFYRLYPEGMLHNYDGHVVHEAPAAYGLDYNRNFPHAWRQEHDQAGAGHFPLSAPETRAIAEFFTQHNNIGFFLALHTGIEVILPPEGERAFADFPLEDRILFKTLSDPGVELLKMAFESLFPVDYGKIHGDFGEWLYEHHGLPGFVIELWAPAAQVGATLKEDIHAGMGFIDAEPIDLRIARLVDEKGWSRELRPWHHFPHPQLGELELGGWRQGFFSQAPDGPELEAIARRTVEYALLLSRALPRVEIRSLQVTPVGGQDAFHVGITLVNSGLLSTHLTANAQKKGLIKEPEVRLELPEGATRTGGQERQKLGHLSGYGGMARAEWVVQAPEGTVVILHVDGAKGGRLRLELPLAR